MARRRPSGISKQRSTRATLRCCASCEWIFKLTGTEMCPKCGFAHYGAHYVYGSKCYSYAKTQKPWIDKKMTAYLSG